MTVRATRGVDERALDVHRGAVGLPQRAVAGQAFADGIGVEEERIVFRPGLPEPFS